MATKKVGDIIFTIDIETPRCINCDSKVIMEARRAEGKILQYSRVAIPFELNNKDKQAFLKGKIVDFENGVIGMFGTGEDIDNQSTYGVALQELGYE